MQNSQAAVWPDSTHTHTHRCKNIPTLVHRLVTQTGNNSKKLNLSFKCRSALCLHISSSSSTCLLCAVARSSPYERCKNKRIIQNGSFISRDPVTRHTHTHTFLAASSSRSSFVKQDTQPLC